LVLLRLLLELLLLLLPALAFAATAALKVAASLGAVDHCSALQGTDWGWVQYQIPDTTFTMNMGYPGRSTADFLKQ
jgi:hypothetical protein